MARNTAEYGSRHTQESVEHSDDHRDDHSTEYKEEDPAARQQAAYRDFTNNLESRHPELAAELRANDHPLSDKHRQEWLNPSTKKDAVAYIQVSFQEATKHLEVTDQYAVARDVGDRLTSTLTYPSRLMADTYNEHPPLESFNNEASRYYELLRDTSEIASNSIEGLGFKVREHLCQDDHRSYFRNEISQTLESMSGTKDNHLKYMARLLQNERPEGLDYSDNRDLDTASHHARALADALYYPIEDRLNQREHHPDPFSAYRERLLQESVDAAMRNPGADYNPATTDVMEFAAKLQEVQQERTTWMERELQGTKENLVHHLSFSESGYNEIHHALTDIQQAYQAIDYQDPKALADDLRAAFEAATGEMGEQHRSEMAHTFADALSWETKAAIQARLEHGSPQSYRERGIPEPDHFYMMVDAAAASMANRADELAEAIRHDVRDSRPSEDLLEHTTELREIEEGLRQLEQTGELPANLEHLANEQYRELDAERTDLMLWRMDQHINEQQTEQHPEQQPGHPGNHGGDHDRKWADRLQDPAAFSNMVAYTNNMQAADQRRIASEIYKRAHTEPAPTA